MSRVEAFMDQDIFYPFTIIRTSDSATFPCRATRRVICLVVFVFVSGMLLANPFFTLITLVMGFPDNPSSPLLVAGGIKLALPLGKGIEEMLVRL